MRKKCRKVSSNWLRIEGKKLFEKAKLENPVKWDGKDFKASFGWMRRFVGRKNIKFRNRRCGKEKTAEEYVDLFENFLEKVRFDFLSPRDGEEESEMDPLWGRFPPERR